MFKKILIANRGEIALRIIRACREMGVPTVAVYSEPDRESLHVRFADEDVCIGPAPPAQSYLDAKRIIAAAEVTGADAVHPGYGFLAENAEFAEILRECAISFIGPEPATIRRMGNKAAARRAMQEGGVPIVPGSDGPVGGAAEGARVAREIGYPVMVKASAGGGGRGLRVCRDEAELNKYIVAAQEEALAAFGDGSVYIEKYLENPRHVEIQVLGDIHGEIIHLGERDCTIQRRHQKLIEESPSPGITAATRQKMETAALLAAVAANYHSAGTVEFLVESTGEFYFMEMNTRIQVEHPVTEEQTDIDLVKHQILVAAGEPLGLTQSAVKFSGHTMEVRINAEDPAHGFRPCPGMIDSFHVPGGHGVRVDTHAYARYTIPPYYDSLLAKLIVHGKNRDEALVKMLRALDEFIIEGVETTIPFLRAVLMTPEFRSGRFGTTFVERYLERQRGETVAPAGHPAA